MDAGETISLNELETTVNKACRGAGVDAGNAAEVGRAAVWLEGQGVDATSVVVEALRSESELLRIGAAVLDGVVADGSAEVECSQPLVVVGLAGAAATPSAGFLLSGDGWDWCVGPSSLDRRRGEPSSGAVQITAGPPPDPGPPDPAAGRATPISPAWRALCDFAARTYVPATEESRIAGAGAGLTDND